MGLWTQLVANNLWTVLVVIGGFCFSASTCTFPPLADQSLLNSKDALLHLTIKRGIFLQGTSEKNVCLRHKHRGKEENLLLQEGSVCFALERLSWNYLLGSVSCSHFKSNWYFDEMTHVQCLFCYSFLGSGELYFYKPKINFIFKETVSFTLLLSNKCWIQAEVFKSKLLIWFDF